MAQPDTVARILDAAEHLFAERGFAETSLRTITARAGVNLAAVNYHFGSKKALIQAVFARFLTPFCQHLDRALDERAADRLPLPELLGLVARSVAAAAARDPARGMVFMRLVGLGYTESQGHLRRYIATGYGATFSRLRRLVAATAPGVAPEEMFWRIHFALGATVFTLSGVSSLTAIAEAEYGSSRTHDEVIARLLPFVTAGILQESA